MKNIRVFISSTFKDLVSERNKLMIAFREAEKCAVKNFINLSEIDFRWGLSDNADVMKSCLESIKTSKHFLCILGGRYGSYPKRENYEKGDNILDEYNDFIENTVFNAENILSYTAMEVYFALSQKFEKENVCFIYLKYKTEIEPKQKELINHIKIHGISIIECDTPDELVNEVSVFLHKIIAANSLCCNDEKDEANTQKYHFSGFNGNNTQQTQLMLYRRTQETTVNSLTQDTFPREQEKMLNDFIISHSKVCCIIGNDGVGKSVLIARWIKNIAEFINNAKITMIYHLWQSRYIDDVFEHLYLELAEINQHSIMEYYSTLIGDSEFMPKALDVFNEALNQHDPNKELLIILDGLEHIVADFSSIIDNFSKSKYKIKLILTIGDIAISSTSVMKVKLPCLGIKTAKSVISNYLIQHAKTEVVSNKIANIIMNNSLFNNIKLLSSVLYDMRAFANHNNVFDIANKYKDMNHTVSVYTYILSHWMGILPIIDDNDLLAYIAYSHFGIAEDDIKIMAGINSENEFLWHQLFVFLEPYVGWNGDRIQFSNKWLKEAIIQNNIQREKEIKINMLSFFQQSNITIEKQFDELPFLLKELNKYDELLSFLLNFTVFKYAINNYNKECTFIDLWSNFTLFDFAKYLEIKCEKQEESATMLKELGDFLCLHGKEMFPEEEREDIEDLHTQFCKKILLAIDGKSNNIELHELASIYWTVAVSYTNSYKYAKAKKILKKGIDMLSPKVKSALELYNTGLMIHKNPEFREKFNDKFTIGCIQSIMKTALLKNLKTYISLLGEMLNTHLPKKQSEKYYGKIMEWIAILELLHINTTLLKSQIDYIYGKCLHEYGDYRDAFDRFHNAFVLKYNYLLHEDKQLRHDSNQEYRLMETYRAIEDCQSRLNDDNFYKEQMIYVEAVEKFWKNNLHFANYCNCVFNYATYLYNQAEKVNDEEQRNQLFQKAALYFDKIILMTSRNKSYINLFIRANYFKMLSLGCINKLESPYGICKLIIKMGRLLSKYEKEDPIMSRILQICNSIISGKSIDEIISLVS